MPIIQPRRTPHALPPRASEEETIDLLALIVDQRFEGFCFCFNLLIVHPENLQEQLIFESPSNCQKSARPVVRVAAGPAAR